MVLWYGISMYIMYIMYSMYVLKINTRTLKQLFSSREKNVLKKAHQQHKNTNMETKYIENIIIDVFLTDYGLIKRKNRRPDIYSCSLHM